LFKSYYGSPLAGVRVVGRYFRRLFPRAGEEVVSVFFGYGDILRNVFAFLIRTAGRSYLSFFNREEGMLDSAI